jgi:uncharacterized protein YciI
MKYAAVIEYLQDAATVGRLRPEHRQYLAALKERGQLAVSGPFADGSGALIVYEAESTEAAEELLKSDPFHRAGVFVRWVLRPWNVVIADREAFPP